MHDFWNYYHRQKEPFIAWIENEDDTVAANSMLIMIARTMAMLEAQMKHLGEEFLENGGFRERMHCSRTDARARQEKTPSCPECGSPMKKRVPRKEGGSPFWGCSSYPDCRGTLQLG